MNLGSFLRTAAARDPERTALRSAAGTLSYGELNARVDALAAGLTSLGLEAGERVVLWLRNGPDFVETFFACWRLGLVAVPVNARLRPADVAYHAADCGAAALVHGPEFADGAAEVEVAHRIGTGERYEALVGAHAGAGDQTRDIPDDTPAWLFYTSGTTGRPKGAVLTHANLTFVTVSWCADLYPLQPEDVVLHAAPLSHGAGFHALAAVARGAENVVLARSDPAAILEAVSRHRVTAAWLVPTQIRMLLDAPELASADLSSLACVVYGGAPMYREDLVEAIRRIGPVFCQLYAQGESPMTVTWLRREDHRLDGPGEVLTSAGRARTGMEVRIADPDDRPVPAGRTGEIQVRGPAVMAGYWGRPEASAEALRGGWLHTGDVGRLDERGYLYVLDRLKDMIITGGSNVYAREVEDVLLRHPAVHDVAVFGVPHRVWGEAVTAVVVGGPGAPPDPDEVRAHCRTHLADFMRPKFVHVAESLPRNSYGKVLKRDLRERYAESAVVDGRA